MRVQRLPATTAGGARARTRNNLTYDRELLPLIADLLMPRLGGGVQCPLASLGHASFLDPAAVMLHKKSFGLGEFIGQRYHYARAYAGLRLRNAPFWRRPLYAGFAVTLLPPFLLRRPAQNVWRNGRHRRELILTLPLLALFVIAWGVGELVGYLFGPGESLGKVE